jgi:PAS domain S-box-containing protein
VPESNIKRKYYDEFFDFLCNHAVLNFFVISKDGKYLLKSKKMENISEIGTIRADLFDETAWKDSLEVMSSKKTKIVEERYKGKNAIYDGHWFLSIKSPLIKDDNIEGVMGVAIDITERKKLEKQLKETTQKLENVLDTIPGNVYWKSLAGDYLGCNNLQAKLLGSSKEDIIGKNDYDFIPKKDADEVRKIDQAVIEKKESRTTEEIVSIQNKNRIFLSKKVPFYDVHDKSKVIGLLGVSMDITDQKRTEQDLLETKHKLEGMTLVSASIAHELRTPLASLEIGIGNLKDYFPVFLEAYQLADKDKLSKKLKPSTIELIQGAFNSMSREVALSNLVINLLLENIKPTVDAGGQDEEFSMVFCVKEALDRYPFKKVQEKLVHFKSEIDFNVMGKEIYVVHILFNLLKNSLYFIEKCRKGEIFIGLELGDYYNTLIFKDTGSGIPENQLSHIFEPFYTKTGHGTGVGLNYCKMASKKLGGNISCESREGEYTLFKLELPKVKSKETS